MATPSLTKVWSPACEGDGFAIPKYAGLTHKEPRDKIPNMLRLNYKPYRFPCNLLFICVLFFSQNCISRAALNEIRIKVVMCDSAGKPLKNIYYENVYVVEGKSVFEKKELISDGKVTARNLDKLDNCMVLDQNNWKCGGVVGYLPNGTRIESSAHQVMNGKYSYFHRSYNLQPDKDIFCKREQVD